MPSGRSPRQKGNRTERALKRYLLQRGLSAERVPLSGSAGGRFGGDLLLTLPGRHHIVLPLALAAEIAVRAK